MCQDNLQDVRLLRRESVTEPAEEGRLLQVAVLVVLGLHEEVVVLPRGDAVGLEPQHLFLSGCIHLFKGKIRCDTGSFFL